MMASCGGKVSEVTEITGTVVPDGISEVNVVLGEALDTLVPVVDGKFAIVVPADVTLIGTISAANFGTNFISDGTPLTVNPGNSWVCIASKSNSQAVIA